LRESEIFRPAPVGEPDADQVHPVVELHHEMGPESLLLTVCGNREQSEQALHRAEALAVDPSTIN
jgi:hypothetical protein